MADKGQLSFMEVKFWSSEAESCVERQRRELVQRNNYPFLINYYEGISSVDPAYPHVASKQKMAIINEYFPNTNSLISELMYQSPDILLEATKPESEEDLPLMKSALTYFFSRSDALIENRIALFDMLYAGYCAVEVDILPKKDRGELITSAPASIEEEEPKSIFDRVAANLKKVITPEDAEQNFAKMSPPIEANFATVQGTYVRRYDPLDVPLDWRAERIRDRRYNIKKVWLSKAEFDVKYPKFKNIVTVEEEKFEHSRHLSDMHNRKVLLYEFQARMKGGQYQTILISPNVKTQEIDTFIRPYITNNFNMKIGTLHKYGKLYSRSMAQINKTMSDELNEYVMHMKDVAERNVPKHVINKDKVDEAGKRALMNSVVNDLVEVEGNVQGAVEPLRPTAVSIENKELLSIFQDQKTKLWSVSESRVGGKASPQFATELAIEESGFESRNIDVQEGLRFLIKEELNTAKDIIATFWDDEVFLKVTGSEKMKWYEPMSVPDPNNPGQSMIINPLAEVLTADYDVNVDIASGIRENKANKLNKMFLFMKNLVEIRQVLIDQGKDINVDEIKKMAKEFGWNPDTIFIEHQPAVAPTVPTACGESISPDEDARRQAEAELQLGGGQV